MTVTPTARYVDYAACPADGSAAGVMPAVGEAAIPLHPPLPLVRASIRIERGWQQNDSLADG